MCSRLAVIGAGPAGLYAAREAMELGFKVDIYEKLAVGERISCAEGFFDLLKLLDPPAAGVHFKVSEVLFTVQETFAVNCEAMNIWMIDRQVWQKALARELRMRGCVIKEYSPVTPDLLEKLQVEYDWVIDASGVSAVSAKAYKAGSGRYAFTAQYTLQGDFSRLYGRLQAVAEPHYLGYYWIFPKNKDCANVGVGWFGKRSPKELQVQQELRRILLKEGLDGYEILKKTGGPIPVKILDNLNFGKVLLVGDSAGLASPLYGGGIDTACISGILAARVLAMGKPELYTGLVRKVLGTRLALEQKILEAWRRLDYNDINDLMAIGFGKGLSKYAKLWKQKNNLIQEVAILRYISGGYIRGDWQNGPNLDQLEKIN